jgi:phosphonate transport system ATP-binding protein
LYQLSAESGKTLVTSLHAIEYARSYFQRIIGLRKGEILFDLSAEEVSSRVIEELYKIKS